MSRLIPGAEKLNIIRVWSGIESYTPDSLPIMAAVARSMACSTPSASAVMAFSSAPASVT
ncbi:hypothetical protein [Pseudomonas syringae]|uniref:hypothetical protein n=1 Tax=Pseudomonas syringae TaxID=317 RepID=UPI0023519A56|nr:hypothetical protein [Pseudomonas syringae]